MPVDDKNIDTAFWKVESKVVDFIDETTCQPEFYFGSTIFDLSSGTPFGLNF